MVMFTSFFPMAVTFLGSMQEVVNRPKLVEAEMPRIDLAGQRAVVTGGCGSLGLELAVQYERGNSSARNNLFVNHFWRTCIISLIIHLFKRNI
jgi:hypothetical protein